MAKKAKKAVKAKKAKQSKVDLSEIRIGETDETSDTALDSLLAIGMMPDEKLNYIVDIGADKTNNVIVTGVPADKTAALYAEGRRRNPKHFRASMLYECFPIGKDDAKISFKDFVAGK
jgi:hypothetical protein